MSNKKKGKKKSISGAPLKHKVKAFFKKHPTNLYTPNSLAAKLDGNIDKKSLKNILKVLYNDEFLYMPVSNKYRLDRKVQAEIDNGSNDKTLKGTVDRTKSGAAYIVPIDDDKSDDIYVAEKNLGTAMHGDTVLVRLFSHRRRPEGAISKVVERKKTRFVGKFLQYKNRSIVEASDGKASFDIWVNDGDSSVAQNQEIVIVDITKWPSRPGQAPLGTVKSVLGEAGSNDAEMKSILIKNGFDLTFPDEVIKESEALSAKISDSEIAKRRDMRKVTTFTIDPETAKDFDDALSIEQLDDGHYEIGVHIADVSHYVREGSALDKEAYERTTSVYLVDRVCPMLPERLSNELCSLRPNEDKCTFSAVFTFDKNHNITERWFGRTITHSDRRFSYEEAQTVIDSSEGDFVHEIQFLNGVANRLRKHRFKNGSINFETDEVKFVLDENNHPIDLVVKERKAAHMLVEDLMLLANREVASYIIKKEESTSQIPFVYRIHDEPDMERVQEFAHFAGQMGYKFDIQTPKQVIDVYNKISAHAHQNEIFKLLQPLAIRTMAKAIYTTENIGHFGLGFDNYAHFTSPIRRYADVLVHRVLYKNLEGKTYRMDKGKLETMAKHISNQERKAMDAERESIKYKQAEFLNDRIGQVLPGIVSGMIDKGFFVQIIGILAEGLVPFSTLDDSYERKDNGMTAVGRKSGDVIHMGTKVKVKIIDVNLQRREIEMGLEEILE